jgi:rhodanese-related sulfurtransferase
MLNLIWIACLVVGCGSAEADSMEKLLAEIRQKYPDVPQLSTEKLAAWLEDKTREAPLLIDARTEKEYAVSHLPGARRAEPGPTLEALLAEVPTHTPAVVYCSVGVRSSRMAEGLIQRGYTNVFNLEGSLFKWANEERPLAEGEDGVVHPYNRRWGRYLEPAHRGESD